MLWAPQTPARSGRSSLRHAGLHPGTAAAGAILPAAATGAVEFALDIDVIDPDSIRTIVEHRAEGPVELFSLDGRPHLAHVRIETTDVAAYGALLTEVSP